MGEGKDISENGSGGNTAWEKKTRLQLEREEKILFAGLKQVIGHVLATVKTQIQIFLAEY